MNTTRSTPRLLPARARTWTLGLATLAAGFLAVTAHAQFTLTILHNNDGESKLLGNSPVGFAGPAHFVSVVEAQRAAATAAGNAVVTISSGDNVLPGTAFAASESDGVFYDALVLNRIGYDAVTIGNHDFDFGPTTLANFIAATDTSITFLSANLDFSLEPDLAAQETAGRIASTIVVNKTAGATPIEVGIIGLTTPTITTISSPGNVVVSSELVAIVQAEIDALETLGVDAIILSSHLQGIASEQALAAQLRGVDVIIAGGGDELLANPTDLLLPGDTLNVERPYPILAPDADGNNIPVVTTTGEYRYLGRLDVSFDVAGNFVSATGGPVRVARDDAATPAADAVAPDPVIQSTVVAPVQAFVNGLESAIIGTTQVPLDGRRAAVRSVETNLGNLIADAFLSAGKARAASFGVDAPAVALVNGGGIRNNAIIPVGSLSVKTTFDISPFGNFVSIVEDVPVPVFKSLLENAVSQTVRNAEGNVVEGASNTGRFAQIAGFSVLYDVEAPASQLNPNGSVATDGSRVLDVVLDSGVELYKNGALVPGAPATIDIATVNFLAGGGDGYPFGGLPFTTLGLTDQQVVANYIQNLPLGVVTTALGYNGPQGRIEVVAAPVVEPTPTPTPAPVPAPLPAPVIVATKSTLKASLSDDSVQIKGRTDGNVVRVTVNGKRARGTRSWKADVDLPGRKKTVRLTIRAFAADGQVTVLKRTIRRK